MRDEEIDTMEAGREMDVLIVKAVFGLELQECLVGGHPPGCPGSIPITPYSTDIAAAWQVVERLFARIPYGDVHIEHLDDEWSVSTCYEKASGGWDGFSRADTAPLAICRAALKAIREEA